MKRLVFLFSVLFILVISSCVKYDEPYLLDENKFTYYVRTDAEAIVVMYREGGVMKSFTLEDKEWHKTIHVEQGEQMYLKLLALNDCEVEFYFGQRGIKRKILPPYILQQYHAIELWYTVD